MRELSQNPDAVRSRTDYRRYKAAALVTTKWSSTYDRKKKRHSCCGAKSPWRHLKDCPRATGDGSLPPDV